jgi:hypothetical protein
MTQQNVNYLSIVNFFLYCEVLSVDKTLNHLRIGALNCIDKLTEIQTIYFILT